MHVPSGSNGSQIVQPVVDKIIPHHTTQDDVCFRDEVIVTGKE